MEGIIVVNKPGGMTSHDVVAYVRKKFRMKRVGHAGTLDPMATGVLIILLGKATKLFNRFVGFDKAYRATLILGTVTDSADTEGKIIEQNPFEHITAEQIENAFANFKGEISQVPPMVSAVKYQGKKLYELARKGIVVERQARNVTISRLETMNIDLPKVQFYMECSKGTYVRQLASDIGEYLECGACISQIERTKVGPFSINEAVSLEDLNENHIRDWRDQKTDS
jgi:tRNA pseudouridine55 synthase